MITVRVARTLPSDSASRYRSSSLDRLWAWRAYKNLVPNDQACRRISCASVAPLMPCEKPG